MKFIDIYKSPNYDLRKKGSLISFAIIHYTAMQTAIGAIDHLCNKKNQVSSHFLIDKKGNIFSLVDEKFRAWHAGISKWKNISDINSNSIGIELDNSGHHLRFENYSKKQIESLAKLLEYIKIKYDIKSDCILGHSDVSPYRKIDPGEKFPWKRLYSLKILNSPLKISKNDFFKIESKLNNNDYCTIKKKSLFMLNSIGYDVSKAKGNLDSFRKIIKVFQMKFLSSKKITGKIDNNTYKELVRIYNHFLTD